MKRAAIILLWALLLAGCTPQPPVVVILVVDDFSPVVSPDLVRGLLKNPGQPLPPEIESLLKVLPSLVNDDGADCVVTDGQIYTSQGMIYTSQGMIYTLEGKAAKSHGEFVYQSLSEAIANETGVSPTTSMDAESSPLPDWLFKVEHWKLPEGDLLVAAVDTQGYTTAVVTQNIEDAIAFFGDDSPTGVRGLGLPVAQGFVLNMSFAVVPCNPKGMDVTDYEADLQTDSDLANLRELLISLNGERGLGLTETQINWFIAPNVQLSYGMGEVPVTSWIGDDPLPGRLVQEKDSGRVISVASAGNSPNVPFPYAPALWPGVLAVSACDVSVNNMQNCTATPFNAGEVLEAGQFDGLLGSSFSAPRVSVKEALYLLRYGMSNHCTDANGNLSQPPLDHADERHPLWNNLLIFDAAQTYCNMTSFP